MNHVPIAIVGAGFAGLGAAIRLTQQGRRDFVVLERGDSVGGTWRDNSYPGCACDIPSHLYSFSFAPNPDWTRLFPRQPELWEYLRSCADRYAITPKIRFGTELLEATWVEDDQRWHLSTSTGDLTADFVIGAFGPLVEPRLPDVPGLGGFPGAVFHSARWDHDHDLDGERVAIVGTGASAIQILPEVQPRAARLVLLQRTAPWVIPRRDRPISPRMQRLLRRFPPARLALRGFLYATREAQLVGFQHPRLMRVIQRAAAQHLQRQVPDPELRERLRPAYTMGCKRILLSDDYYPALGRENVDLATGGLREVRGSTVVAGDGSEHEVDTIVFGTGFHVTDAPFRTRIRGREGLTLDDRWQGSPAAHRGTTVHGFPNIFFLAGPNTGLGHNSIVYMLESQIAYVLDALRLMDVRGAATIEPRAEAQTAFNAQVDADMHRTVWERGGCQSWYVDATGRNSTLWPGSTWAFRRMLRRVDAGEFVLRPRAGVPVAA